MKKCVHSYDDIISVENLLCAWREFERGKKKKDDVMEFKRHLMTHILNFHTELKEKKYIHGAYEHFVICDPKRRDIHKAGVRDRLLHHAIYRKLYPLFDTTFIADSYSCRDNKGTHRALRRFDVFARKVSKNYTRTCWVLKCDIRKFFASVDHQILMRILENRIEDKEVLGLFQNIVKSFSSNCSVIPAKAGIQVKNFITQNRTLDSRLRGPRHEACWFRNDKLKGLPLGNLTSQLLVNIYMNEFDQYVKHVLKVKYYIRYADDFVSLSENKNELELLRQKIEDFLTQNLKLTLHPDKCFIKTYASGIDFLGWVHFPYHKVLRTVTKKRMFRKVSEKNITSYLGLLQHGNGHEIFEEIRSILLYARS